MAPPALIDSRLLTLLSESEGLKVSKITSLYNSTYSNRYDRRFLAGRLNELVKRGKLIKFKDEHAKVGERCLKYFVVE